MRGPRAGHPTVVLQSFPQPRSTTNPYLSQLVESSPEDVKVVGFSWRTALWGRYDVLHIHWPELLLRNPSPVRVAVRRMLFSAMLLRTRVAGIAVVRTLHNTEAHEPGPLVERLLVDLSLRCTDLWIRLNGVTEPPRPGPVRTILHGDYIAWYADHPGADAVPGRILYFGLVRSYKRVDDLVSTFSAVADEDLSLHIVGRPITEDLRALVVAAAGDDERVRLTLDHVDDRDLAREIGEAEVVVLPYREMHNSGAALLALSLHRPVLVPSGEVTDALAEEVGAEWILRFEGNLDPEQLTAAVISARTVRGRRPDLSLRSWQLIARQHADAYAESLRGVRPRRPSRAASSR